MILRRTYRVYTDATPKRVAKVIGGGQKFCIFLRFDHRPRASVVRRRFDAELKRFCRKHWRRLRGEPVLMQEASSLTHSLPGGLMEWTQLWELEAVA